MKKAILVVSFGTSFDETREKTIGAIEKEIAKEFPDYIVKRAFTSGVIMNNLAKRGIIIPNVVTALRGQDVDMLELNISCPNVSEGGLAFGTDPKLVEKVVSSVKQVADRPLIVKLTPNVTDITEIARAAVAGGADALSLINTLTGMKIDVNRRTFAVANKTAGVSGPAIHPIAVRMVYQVANAINLL